MATDLKFNTAMANKILDSGITQTLFDSGTLELRDGTKPVDANAALTGSQVAIVDLPGTNAFSAASSGVMSKNGTWEELSAPGGTASWFTLRSVSPFTYRIDGTVGNPGSTFETKTGTVSATAYTLDDTGLTMTTDEHVGRELLIASGTGSGQRRRISNNSDTEFRIHPAWSTVPDGTSTFEVLEKFDLRMPNPTVPASDKVVVDSFDIDLGYLI